MRGRGHIPWLLPHLPPVSSDQTTGITKGCGCAPPLSPALPPLLPQAALFSPPHVALPSFSPPPPCCGHAAGVDPEDVDSGGRPCSAGGLPPGESTGDPHPTGTGSHMLSNLISKKKKSLQDRFGNVSVLDNNPAVLKLMLMEYFCLYFLE